MMGLVQHQINGGGPVIPKGPAELNQYMQDEQKARGGITGEGQDLSAEDESRINDVIGDENDGRIEVLKIENLVRKGTQQQTQKPLLRWERFLPVRSLKVLLVENDDSTRHVVCALLRNCGYEGRKQPFPSQRGYSRAMEFFLVLSQLICYKDYTGSQRLPKPVSQGRLC
ncbi:two-component response regulator-like APRR7 isoform X1 [Senna tora]|uniref:Two-component response regulator-like APRR7 isoform X1 n=1 Tax=Senna tora TaxID=362788 RepID=A0A834WA80_9FABA|nr:two-component response regulator-like APRR7 isoform X1 [Senna tora]